jgi:hypothetical protein
LLLKQKQETGDADMTKFVREQFSYHGGYLSYGADRKFVARFKYAQTSSKGSWITFMVKNFTVEEYFSRLDERETPLAIMESKGYLLSHVKKILKAKGYPLTPEGMTQMIKDQIAARQLEVVDIVPAQA